MTALFIILFLVIFGAALLAFGVGFKVVESHRRKKVEESLKVASSAESPAVTSIKSENIHKAPSSSDRLLEFESLRKLDDAIRCASLGWTVESVLIAAAFLAVIGAVIGSRITFLQVPWLSGLGLALVFGYSPFWFIYHKRAGRLEEFEKQIPDALDFIARSVRAGHGIAIGFELLANEAEAPLGPEFRHVSNELNLGTPFDTALRHLVDRVPLVDVRLFVSAVLLQRETGGNLAEILTSIAGVIRARFQLRNQVKALSAHGRITATVLTVLPILIAIGMSIIAPDYIPGMLRDSFGKKMAIGAVLGQVLGYWVMKRMVNIKV